MKTTMQHPQMLRKMQSAGCLLVFVGYRFPNTDALARGELLGAIKGNVGETSIRIHTVLGPQIQDTTTVRLHALLKHSISGKRQDAGTLTFNNPLCGGTKTYRMTAQPFYAEDFFTVMTREELFVGKR